MLPRAGLDRLPTVCAFRLSTGLPCPTCGMTRSWHSMARLDPAQAFRDHPFGPLVFTLIGMRVFRPDLAERLIRRADGLSPAAKAAAILVWAGWWLVRVAAVRRATS
jgi:hypothetical protein